MAFFAQITPCQFIFPHHPVKSARRLILAKQPILQKQLSQSLVAPLRSPILERMSTEFKHSMTLPDEDSSRAFAQKMARVVGPGDVLALEGQIGAGKTFFARALIQTLLAEQGLAEDIPSPTFTLVQTYQAGSLEIWHSDLYRLSDPFEVVELGLEDAFDSALCLIEWPEKLGNALPPRTLVLNFKALESDDQRALTLTSAEHKWFTRLSPILTTTKQDAHV